VEVWGQRRRILLGALVGSIGLQPAVGQAQDATWLANPGSANFNTGSNWSTGSVPTGTATFGASSTTSLNFNATSLGGLTFSAAAGAYTLSATGATIDFTGAGIVNNSSQTQTITLDSSSQLTFNNSSSAANATITNNGTLNFFDSSTASSSTINNSWASAVLSFDESATAGSATINNTGGATLCFCNDATPGSATIFNGSGSFVRFQGNNASNQMRYVGQGGTLDLTGMLVTSLATGSIEGTGTIDLGGNNLSAGANNRSTTFSGVISGTGGSLVKTGTGTLTLSGANTYTGGTTVNGGSLLVTGSLASGVTIGSSGSLGGTGSITGNVVNNGTLSPGTSIGTLTVAGNYTQAAGSTYQVEINPAGQSDRLNVTGTATISGGTVSVVAGSGSYARNTSYTILNATGGVTGTYSGVTSNLAFLSPTLRYDANNVFLDLILANNAFERGAQTGNQRSVGAVLDQAASFATGDFSNVINAIANLDTTQGPRALDAIGGQNYSGFSTASVQSAQVFMTNFANQVGGGNSSGTGGRVALAEACDVACDASDPSRWGAWGGGLGSFGTVAGDANSFGVTYSLGGFAAGLDHRFSPRFLAGVTAGYTSANLYTQNMPGRGTSGTVQFGVYGSFTEGALYLDALAGYARSDNAMTRPIQIPGLAARTAQSQTTANQFFGQLEGGYRIELDDSVGAFVTPFARLQASTSTQAAFSEWGADSLNLNVAAQTTNSLRSVFGAQIGAGLDAGWRDKLNLVLRLGWAHEHADTNRPVTASFAGAPALSFTTAGAAAPRDGAIIGLAANTAVADATSVYFRYDGDMAGGNTSHILSAGLRMTW
jgi:outer membrane autotransporter protein